MAQRLKERRPDKEIYVPRHKRNLNKDVPSSPILDTNDKASTVVDEEKLLLSSSKCGCGRGTKNKTSSQGNLQQELSPNSARQRRQQQKEKEKENNGREYNRDTNHRRNKKETVRDEASNCYGGKQPISTRGSGSHSEETSKIHNISNHSTSDVKPEFITMEDECYNVKLDERYDSKRDQRYDTKGDQCYDTKRNVNNSNLLSSSSEVSDQKQEFMSKDKRYDTNGRSDVLLSSDSHVSDQKQEFVSKDECYDTNGRSDVLLSSASQVSNQKQEFVSKDECYDTNGRSDVLFSSASHVSDQKQEFMSKDDHYDTNGRSDVLMSSASQVSDQKQECRSKDEHYDTNGQSDVLLTSACYISNINSQIILNNAFQYMEERRKHHQTISKYSNKLSKLLLEQSYQTSVKMKQKYECIGMFSSRISCTAIDEALFCLCKVERKAVIGESSHTLHHPILENNNYELSNTSERSDSYKPLNTFEQSNTCKYSNISNFVNDIIYVAKANALEFLKTEIKFYRQFLLNDDTNSEKSNKTDRDKSEGDKSDGDKSDGDKGDGDKGDGDKGDGDKGGVDKGNGDKGNGDKGDGDQLIYDVDDVDTADQECGSANNDMVLQRKLESPFITNIDGLKTKDCLITRTKECTPPRETKNVHTSTNNDVTTADLTDAKTTTGEGYKEKENSIEVNKKNKPVIETKETKEDYAMGRQPKGIKTMTKPSPITKKKKKTKEKQQEVLVNPERKKKRKEMSPLGKTDNVKKLSEERVPSAENKEAGEKSLLDDWEASYTEDGECLKEDTYEASVLSGILESTESDEVIDYLQFKPKDIVLDIGEFGHVLELFDFPSSYKSSDLFSLMKSAGIADYSLHWVDDTHALAVFPSQVAAHNALKVNMPFLQMRQVVNGTKESRIKSKDLKGLTSFSDAMLPYKKRPQTTSMVARNLVAGALGVRSNATKEQRSKEKEMLRQAREEKKWKEKQRREIWDS